jgi:hypothetical protein
MGAMIGTTYRILAKNKRLLRKLRHRRKDNIKMHLKKIGG